MSSISLKQTRVLHLTKPEADGTCYSVNILCVKEYMNKESEAYGIMVDETLAGCQIHWEW